MAELEGLRNNSYYLSSLQAASSAAVRNQKTEKAKETDKTKKSRFADILKKTDENEAFSAKGLPPEIQGMNIEEAAVYLMDAVDTTGNSLKNNMTIENLNQFKKTLSQFITFVVDNNFEQHRQEDPRVLIARRRGLPEPMRPPAPPTFSTYNTQTRKIDPKVTIKVINAKLDEITREMLKRQSDNLKILSNIDEIKGLVVDIING